MSKDAQEIPQSRRKAFPKYPMKEKLGILKAK